MEPDAIHFLAGVGRVERPVWAAARHPDFLPGIGARLHFYGARAFPQVALHGPGDLWDNRVECLDRVCIYHGHYRSRGAREKVRNAWGSLWRGLRCGAGRGRHAGPLSLACAILGRGLPKPCEFPLRTVRAAGIAAKGKTGEISLAYGQSSGLSDAAALASGIGGPVRGCDTLLPGTPVPAERLGALHRISIRLGH